MFDQYLKSKKSKIIVAIAVVFVAVFAYVAVISKDSKKFKQWQPITQEINIEYGGSDTIDKRSFIRANDDVEVVSIDLEIPFTKDDKSEKTYYKLGTYDGMLKVKLGRYDQEFPFKVIVRDTIAPRFTKYSERITIPVGYNGTFNEFFEFDDVDEVIVDIDTDSINTYVPSLYTSTVFAKDSSNNTTERKFFVEVQGLSTPELPFNPIVPPIESEEVIKTHKDIIVYKNIAYNVKRIADPSLLIGEEVIETPGTHGKLEVNVRVFYENDKEVRRQTISETIKEVPVDEIIRYGTKEEQEEQEPIEGAFNEFPLGLVQYETSVENGVTFGKEYYESLDEAIVRGEDLVLRKLITEYTQRSVTFNEMKYYYIVFSIE